MLSPVSAAYEKLWADPSLQSRIDEGVRLHRQSDAVIDVTGFDGEPMPGVKNRAGSGIQSAVTLEPGKTVEQLIRL